MMELTWLILTAVTLGKSFSLDLSLKASRISGFSDQYRSQNTLGEYTFGYNEDHAGGGSFRREAGDRLGNKAGSYGLRVGDGRVRVVNYVADAGGFRADVVSNEPGLRSQDSNGPARVTRTSIRAVVAPGLRYSPMAPPVGDEGDEASFGDRLTRGRGKESILGRGKESILGRGKESILGRGKESILGRGEESILGRGKESILGRGKESILGRGLFVTRLQTVPVGNAAREKLDRDGGRRFVYDVADDGRLDGEPQLESSIDVADEYAVNGDDEAPRFQRGGRSYEGTVFGRSSSSGGDISESGFGQGHGWYSYHPSQNDRDEETRTNEHEERSFDVQQEYKDFQGTFKNVGLQSESDSGGSHLMHEGQPLDDDAGYEGFGDVFESASHQQGATNSGSFDHGKIESNDAAIEPQINGVLSSNKSYAANEYLLKNAGTVLSP